MSASGRKLIVVPVSLGRLALVKLGDAACHARTSGVHRNPSRRISAVEPLREGVDHRDADAVQAAGDLVAAAVAELAAGVQDGEHDLEGRALFLLHDRDRNTAAVVDDRDRAVRMDRHRTRSQRPASASSTELSTTS